MERLEKNAIEILHMMCERSECIICDSGGKDSSVLKHIALQAKEKYGLQVQSNSYDFATRLIPIGKDGLMLNIDGKNYVENHQYSKKVKTMTWKDERYAKC